MKFEADYRIIFGVMAVGLAFMVGGKYYDNYIVILVGCGGMLAGSLALFKY